MQTDPVNLANKSMPIFDVDTHWAEPPTLWTERAPAKYKGKVFEVKEKPDNSEAWFVGDQHIAMIGPAVVKKDMTKQLNAYTVPRYDLMSPAVSVPEDKLKYMNSAGIGAEIMYPNVIGFGGQALMKVFPDDAELRLWHVHTYNDAALEMQKRGGNRILGQAALPLWDIEASIQELGRIKKMGLTGIAMSDAPQNFGSPPLTSPEWQRFWETCQDLEIPVNFHIGSGTWEGDMRKFWAIDGNPGINPDGSLNGPVCIFAALSNFVNNQFDVLNLILSGHLEKYPRIKYVSVESGAGWAPFLIQVMMYQWGEMMSPSQRKSFTRTPFEAFREQIYMTIYCEEHWNVDAYKGYFGVDNLLFETDFPHPTSVYPHADSPFKSAWEYADAITKNLNAEDKAKVLYKNAEKLYGVKIQTSA